MTDKKFVCEEHKVSFKGAGGLASHMNSPKFHPELAKKRRKRPRPQMKNATKVPVEKQEFSQKDLIAIIQVKIDALIDVKKMLEGM